MRHRRRGIGEEALRAALRHAYDHVPHDRRAFDAAGVHPDDCKDLVDLAGFPFTGKDDLRENYPFGIFATWLAPHFQCVLSRLCRLDELTAPAPAGG